MRRFIPLFALVWALATTLPVVAEDEGFRLMAGESLGGIKIGTAEKKLLLLLGQPKKKGQLTYMDATGEHYQMWFYPEKGLEIWMSAGETKTGPKKIATILASAGCALATARGIKIGSPEAAVRKTYRPFEDKEMGSKDSFVAGSVYGGMIFNFKDKKVSRIFLGAAAE